MVFFVSILLYSSFSSTDLILANQFQFVFIQESSWLNWAFDVDLILGIDGLSLCFILLTTFIIPFCILAT
jgi:NADH:ubiquinone oxidoreductase subunit 4 (subunit M)